MITREIIIGFSGNPPINTDSIYERTLVRCKDCKHWVKDEGYCKDTELYIADGDWFCADGVKKDG